MATKKHDKNQLLPLSSLLTGLRSQSFELQLWLILSSLAGIRTLKAVVQDLLEGSYDITLLIDLCLLGTLATIVCLISINRIRYVPVAVGVILASFVMGAHIHFGGLPGMSEYNMMAASLVLSMGYSGRRLVVMISIYFAFLFYSIIEPHFNGPLTLMLYQKDSIRLDNYFSTLVMMLIIMLYFKGLLNNESSRLREVRRQLGQEHRLASDKNTELQMQHDLVSHANEELRREIRYHGDNLAIQDKVLEEYMGLSTRQMQAPLDHINQSAAQLMDNSHLVLLLKAQIEELNMVTADLIQKLNHPTDHG